jgi:heme/copper-type cytochrome/quinol oxidase subunit 3
MEQAINRPSLDVSKLPNVGFGTKSITWWGVMGMMAIEATVFALMIAAYFYLSTRSIEWPPHRDPPDLLWGTLNTLVFLVSVLPNEWYRRRAPKGDLTSVRVGLVVLTLFGLMNIVIRYFELTHMNTDWSIDAYGSAVWTLIGLHVVHLVTDWVDTVVLTVLFFRPGLIEGKRFVDAAENAGYWNFVVLTWIPIYLVIYWAPRWLHA